MLSQALTHIAAEIAPARRVLPARTVDHRLFVLGALVALAGCRPTHWRHQSDAGIPNEATVWVLPMRGDDRELMRDAVASLHNKVVGFLVRDGAKVRTDPPPPDAWTVELFVADAVGCGSRAWLRPCRFERAARGAARPPSGGRRFLAARGVVRAHASQATSAISPLPPVPVPSRPSPLNLSQTK